MRFRAEIAEDICEMKKSKRFFTILILLFVLAFAALVIGALFNFFGEQPENEQEETAPELTETEEPPPIETDDIDDEELVVLSRFTDYMEQNEDLVGWIRVPNTAINFPVVYCSDNAFYLNHDFLKRPAGAGTPFLDMDAGILENNQSLSIYAHYSTTFTALHEYKKLEYYKEYPLFEFSTLYEDGFYKIFSVFYMAGNSSDKLFYYYPVSHFSSDAAFMKHVDELRARSIFTTAVDVNPEDQLLLMTCCTYETNNLRLIVAGRKIRPGESIIVDTEAAHVNPEPLYPQKWYDAKGGNPPDLTDS